MNLFRSILKAITRYKLTSFILALFAIGSVYFVRTAMLRSRGSVSDPLKRGTVFDAIYGIGTVTAVRSYAIKPGVIATIQNLYVREGDFVHKGKLLARIDGAIYRSPFDGVVNFLPFKAGENIFTQLPVLVLTDLANRYVVVTLEQQGALRVRPGQKAKISFDSMRSRSFDGAIESVYSYNNSFLARIDVANLPKEILPDMTADIAIVIREIKDALIIPVSALEADSVWVKRGHSVPTQVKIKLGVVDGTMAEVVSGDLNPGDRLMIRNRLAP